MSALTVLTVAHAGVMAAMHRVCFAEPWDEAAMQSLLAMPGVYGWLQEGELPQGLVLARLAADEAEILTLLILPPFRRAGVARHLLEAAAAEARQRGAARMFLEVAANNEAALALYSDCGFTQAAVRPRYYSGTIDALLMYRNL